VSRRTILVATTVLAWVAGSTLGSLPTTTAGAATPAIVVGKAHAGFTPDPTGRRTIAILVVGSDARPGGNALGARSDSIHVVLVNPRKRQAVVVGIPRDSWVRIPGLGTDKINASLPSGGPDRLVATIESNFGVRIDYWAITAFSGVTHMVDEAGGIDVRVPFTVGTFRPGRKHFTGWAVLTFSRNRKSLRAGDFGRQENGGRMLIAALDEFQRDVEEDPGQLLVWVGAAMRNMHTDLSVQEIVDLAFSGLRVRVGNVRNVVLPGGTGSAGGKSVVFLSMSAARTIFNDAEIDGALTRRNVPRSPTAGE
jgi:LCP family protein required for cell wall assembly